MVPLLTHAVAICCAFLSMPVALSQEPERKPDQPSKAVTDDKDPSRVRAHMRRVQTVFDEINSAVWFRVAFVATVTDVRPLKETDTLMGTLAGDETEVAVLRIRAVGILSHATLQENKIIVFPAGELRDRLLQWREQKSEVLFEYSRFRNKESVQKFGC